VSRTPAIGQSEHARRRARLMRRLGREAAAVVPAARPCLRNRDVEHPFRQDSDFLYLTGFPEPEAVAVLLPGRREGAYVLFCRDRDPVLERWTGPRIGPEGARRRYGADQAFPLEELDRRMPELLAGRRCLHAPWGRDEAFDRRLAAWVERVRGAARAGVGAPEALVDLGAALHELRLRKSRAELAMMRRAAQVTVEAHRRLMRRCRPGLAEHALEAELWHAFRSAGCVPAYPPIVAGGPRACVLHYTANDAELEPGQLVLVDAGAEHGGYAADLTRTFPVDGRFTAPQRELYEVVLRAQQAALAQVRPGRSWDAPHRAAVRALTRGLLELGLLRGRLEELIRKEAYRTYYMHRTGHWLGLDVHDVGAYRVDGRWRPLEPGMVLTVEPGLYVPEDASGRARRWRGIGIRIEDDVVVTRDGHRVLTEGVPKDPEAIEALMAAGAG